MTHHSAWMRYPLRFSPHGGQSGNGVRLSLNAGEFRQFYAITPQFAAFAGTGRTLLSAICNSSSLHMMGNCNFFMAHLLPYKHSPVGQSHAACSIVCFAPSIISHSASWSDFHLAFCFLLAR